MSGRRAGGWAVLAGVALVVAGGGVVAQAAPPRPAAAPACATSAAEGAAAVALAQRCKAEVEVVSERTEWNTTTALPDGSMRLDVSTGAVRTKESGSWEAVDNTVVPGDGVLQVASAVTPMRFSDGSGDEPFATIERDGHELAFDMPFDLPKPSVDGAQLTYAQVLPGVDLVVTVNEDATGFSEVLRVESARAAANLRLKDLSFPVETSNGIDLEAQDGGFVAADDNGKPVFTSPTPAMWDSSGVELAPGKVDRAVGPKQNLADPTVEPAGGETVAVISSEVSADEVTITPDADMLRDSATVWPVYIDPGMSGSLNRRSAVRTEVGTKYDFLGDEGVGLCSRASSSTCSTTFKSRLLYQFAGLEAIGAMNPNDVVAATFSVTGTHSNSCTPHPVTLFAVANFDQNTEYPGGPHWTALQTLNIAHRALCGAGLEPRRIEFDATAHARAVASVDASLASFGIASDESSMAYWKRYGWDASFSISYNRAPSLPTSVRTTNPDTPCTTGAGRPYIRSANPTLRAALSDPDGENVQGNFDLATVANPSALLWDPALTPGQGSGAEHSVQVPGLLSDNGVYQWRVNGVDSRQSGPVQTCEFAVDLTDPLLPGVTGIAGQAATYAEDATAGGIGASGLFRFSNGGSADVAHYLYSFNNTGLGSSVAVDTPTIFFTPTFAGPQTLSVKSVDRSGRTSPVRTYRFTVGFAAVSDAWQLDEVIGTTAANAVATVPRPLAVSSSVLRVSGVGQEFKVPRLEADLALKFDAADDAASTSGPIVATDQSFSVMAYVKLDDVNGTYTAVSQDGTQVSGFELGHRVDPSCPTGTDGHCWAFWMPGSDSAAQPVAAMSAVPARAGSWVQLTGIRSGGTLQLAVCEIGSPAKPGSAVPVPGTSRAAPSPWLAAGAFHVGRGKAAAAPARHWHGAVSQVRTYTRDVDITQLRTSCSNPGSLMPALDQQPPTAAAKNAQGADFDGNGKADVFWSSLVDGRWRISYNGTTPWVNVNGAGAIRSDQFRYGDINGDGKDDVFYAVPDGRWLVSYGATTGWQQLGTAGIPNDQLALADLTGDGKADVFWVNPANGLWYISDGAVSDWRQINGAPGIRTDQFRFADVDGDGKDDVFFANPWDGRWMVSYGGTTGWAAVNLANVPNDQLLLADMTGDGKADVFWVNPANGLWYVSEATTGGWRQINGAPGIRTDQYQLADMTGDGKADVFFANPWDGRWMVSDGGTAGWSSVNGDSTVLPDRVLVR